MERPVRSVRQVKAPAKRLQWKIATTKTALQKKRGANPDFRGKNVESRI